MTWSSPSGAGLTTALLIFRTARVRYRQLSLTVLCITIALGAGTTAVGFAESVERGVAAGGFFRSSDLLVLQAGKASTMTSRLPAEAVADVRALDGVERARVLLFDFLTLNERQNVLVYGIPSDSPELHLDDAQGERLLRRDELLVGRGAAALAGLEEGDQIDLNFGSFRIAGILDAGSFLENGVIYMRLQDMQRITGAGGHVSFILVDLTRKAAPEAVAPRIEALVPGSRVLTSEEFIGDDQSLQVLHALSQVVLVTTALLAALLAGAIMVMTANARRRELAVLRAIGWSSARIAGLIFLEVLLLTLVGAMLGSVLGWIGLEQALLNLRTMGVFIESVITVPMVLMAAVAIAAIALTGAAIPVWHVLRINVWEALKQQ